MLTTFRHILLQVSGSVVSFAVVVAVDGEKRGVCCRVKIYVLVLEELRDSLHLWRSCFTQVVIVLLWRVKKLHFFMNVDCC